MTINFSSSPLFCTIWCFISYWVTYCIISLRGKVCARNTDLTRLFLLKCVCQAMKHSVNVFVLRVSMLSLSKFFLGFRNVLTVWYFLLLILLQIQRWTQSTFKRNQSRQTCTKYHSVDIFIFCFYNDHYMWHTDK